MNLDEVNSPDETHGSSDMDISFENFQMRSVCVCERQNAFAIRRCNTDCVDIYAAYHIDIGFSLSRQCGNDIVR